MLDDPVWWADRQARSITVQFLHPAQLRPGPAEPRWRDDGSVDVLVEFDQMPDGQTNRGELAELTTRHVPLHGTGNNLAIRFFANGTELPTRKLSSHVTPASRPRAQPSADNKLVHDCAHGVDGLSLPESTVVTCTPVTFEFVAADDVLAAELGVAVGKRVLHLERVWSANGEALLLEDAHLSASPFSALPDLVPPSTRLRQAFQLAFDEVVERVEIYFEVAVASYREAELVHATPGDPVLVAHSIAHNESDEPLFRVRAMYRGDRVALAAQRDNRS